MPTRLCLHGVEPVLEGVLQPRLSKLQVPLQAGRQRNDKNKHAAVVRSAVQRLRSLCRLCRRGPLHTSALPARQAGAHNCEPPTLLGESHSYPPIFTFWRSDFTSRQIGSCRLLLLLLLCVPCATWPFCAGPTSTRGKWSCGASQSLLASPPLCLPPHELSSMAAVAATPCSVPVAPQASVQPKKLCRALLPPPGLPQFPEGASKAWNLQASEAGISASRTPGARGPGVEGGTSLGSTAVAAAAATAAAAAGSELFAAVAAATATGPVDRAAESMRWTTVGGITRVRKPRDSCGGAGGKHSRRRWLDRRRAAPGSVASVIVRSHAICPARWAKGATSLAAHPASSACFGWT